MSKEPLLNDKIIARILTIQDSGVTNMFDVKRVQREAYRKGYHELAVFLEEHRKEYIKFILTGKRE